MNYLGHLYLSGDSHPLMVANIFGDFVKGKDYTYLPKIIQKGVLLHRNIDDFIDHHPVVLDVTRSLYSQLPKVSGIAIDLIFDHLLAKNWKKYHPLALDEYVDSFFQYALKKENSTFLNPSFSYPENFLSLLHIMNERKWLTEYAQLEGLIMASKGLEKRLSFPNKLGETATVFVEHQTSLQKAFDIYMEDAIHLFLG